MLERIGVRSVDDLLASIPHACRLQRPLRLEPALAEPALMAHLTELASANTAAGALSFLGGGIYDHHIPPAVDQLLLRSELYTAYTPYQAELSQGILQATFEFQTMACDLLGLEVANASLYDGASATAEAVLMARRVTGRSHAVVSAGVHPEYVETVRTYVSGLDDGSPRVEIAAVGRNGQTDLAALERLVRDDSAAVVVGYPNFLGCIEDLAALHGVAKRRGALLVTVTTEPYALSLVEAPGLLGADIAVGEGQAMAAPPNLGGPGVGLFACRDAHVRQMPGRLVGQTVDARGKRGFVLTLSTREQHIRRDRATSNICTNHALIAISFAIRAAMLGRRGFEQAGRLCLSKTEYLKSRIARMDRLELAHAAPTFNEFVVRRKGGDARPLLDDLAAEGVLGGVELGRFFRDRPRDFLVAVTEKHTRQQLDRFCDLLAERA
jgi:glycine dehydrogenase subunit 1